MSGWARRVQGTIVGAGIATLASVGAAGASQSPQITVTPRAGLDDGQVVQVDGTGWPDPAGPDQNWFLAQCSGSSGFDPQRCGRLQTIPESEISSDGSFSVPYAVARSFESYEDGNTVVCGRQADDCSVAAVELVVNPYRPAGYTVAAAISFAPASK